MALYRWFPDWTPILLGTEEKYGYDDFTIHFHPPRWDERNGIGFLYMVGNAKTSKVVHTEFCLLEELHNNREKLMMKIRDKVTELTGIAIAPPIAITPPSQLKIKVPTREEEIETKMMRELLISTRRNETEKIKEILSCFHFSDPEIPENLLCLSAFNGNLEIMKLILKNQPVDINKAKYNHQSPLILAISKGHYEVFKFLEKIMIIPEDIIYQAIKSFNQDGDIDNVARGLRHGNRIETPQFIKIIKDLLDNKDMSKNSWYDYCLGECAYGNNYELVKLFLSYEETDSMKGDLLMNYVCPTNNGNFELMKLIIGHEKTDLSQQIIMKWPWLGIKRGQSQEMTLGEAIINVARHRHESDADEFIKYVKSKIDSENRTIIHISKQN